MNTVPVEDPLLALVRAAYEPSDGRGDGDQMWRVQWWRPKWGCDTLDHLLDHVQWHLQEKGKHT